MHEVSGPHSVSTREFAGCGKQVKCPEEVASEVSGQSAGVEIMLRLRKARTDEAIWGSGGEAEDESSGSDFARDEWRDFMDAGGGDPGFSPLNLLRRKQRHHEHGYEGLLDQRTWRMPPLQPGSFAQTTFLSKMFPL